MNQHYVVLFLLQVIPKGDLTSDSLLNCSLIITDNRRPKDLLRPRICKECARYNPASV